MLKVPMVDTQAWHAPVQDELEQAALRVLRSGQFISGAEVAAFEQESACYLGSPYAVSCANGTDALVLALLTAGIGNGDEVITTPFSFFATTEAILRVGATPVFVDIDHKTFNLDPALIPPAISAKTKAVLVVHLFGLPAELDALTVITEKYGLLLIEDCAQAFGASYQEKKVGAFGHIGCFSFFPSKNLGGFGDGGLITTGSAAIADQLKQLRNHGSRLSYYHESVGYNSRLDEVQAALLRVKLKHINHYNHQRRQVAQWYKEYLSEAPLVLPSGNDENTHTYNQFTVLVPDHRDAVQKQLEKQSIASRVFYPTPLYRQPVLSNASRPLPVCEKVCEQCLSLPIFPGMVAEKVKALSAILLEILA
ncbi:DegT/DnrJ/EryC1/StrS family aminotransferase [Candidatus Sororendozoicomonas aggregata]|uniref:DegT/DnrJ/EryC1/StrS family aminotransferase n=1 Tax=Candidatus Sororendozoicomonas aggregata TaxID=3073239 RepID=UPI002ED1A6B0